MQSSQIWCVDWTALWTPSIMGIVTYWHHGKNAYMRKGNMDTRHRNEKMLGSDIGNMFDAGHCTVRRLESVGGIFMRDTTGDWKLKVDYFMYDFLAFNESRRMFHTPQRVFRTHNEVCWYCLYSLCIILICCKSNAAKRAQIKSI